MTDSILLQVKGPNHLLETKFLEDKLKEFGFKKRVLKINADGTFKTRKKGFSFINDAIFINNISVEESNLIKEFVIENSKKNNLIYILDFQNESYSEDMRIENGKIVYSTNK